MPDNCDVELGQQTMMVKRAPEATQIGERERERERDEDLTCATNEDVEESEHRRETNLAEKAQQDAREPEKIYKK